MTTTAVNAVHISTEPSHSTRGEAVHDSWDAFPLLIPVARVADLLGVSRASAYRYAEAGDLPVVRLGGRVFIHRERLRIQLATGAAAAA